jgi:hypothetical protein
MGENTTNKEIEAALCKNSCTEDDVIKAIVYKMTYGPNVRDRVKAKKLLIVLICTMHYQTRS